MKTTVEPTEHGHRRIHEITSRYACQAYDCGFAVASDSVRECVKTEEENMAEVRNEDGFCAVKAVETPGKGCVLDAIPNSNVLRTKTAIPMVGYQIPEGTSRFVTEIINA